ncbi:radical SAM protein [Kitasatospora sp. MMS16-BH015]|uniref:StsB family radical SAM/SPASM domain sactipeptide maturase n=1 Tax=Kitasatospora sp. MMS16-BH015 TaxID=2018025 RepID=UPI000CA2C150|nr:StsB family radical SAM/SPASM domain sactipeptide maturase [Kitasatospora sp. MMS16-BH015]AUG81139.1 radical SAM protein [Kitasatospora sp. MMS16-BH015]
MKLLELWGELIVPEDLVYFRNGADRLVTNPELAAWCLLSEPEAAVLRALSGPDRAAGRPTEDTGAAERTLAKLVLNWLVYLPGRRPVVRAPEPALSMVYYAITDGCNLRCPYCYASSEKPLPGELTTAESLDLVDQAAEMGARTMVFTGGEPMLRKDLFAVARHARERGLAANIITNGTTIRRLETAREMAEIFNLVTVSLDGGTVETHERTRGEGTFAKTAQALRLLNQAGVSPVINHVVTPDSVQVLDQLADFVSGLEIRKVRLMNHSDLGRGASDQFDYGWADYQKVLDFVWTHPIADKLLPEGPKAAKPCSVKGNCGMGGTEIYVNSLGTVYPCKLVTEQKHIAGNLRRQRLAEIFAAPVLADLRSNSVFAGDNLQDCRRCYIRGACGGGCRAYHLAETGDLKRNGRHLCRILRQSMVAGMWDATGVTGPELKAGREELFRPYLVRDDSEHPVYQDWKTARRLLPLAD